MGAVVLKLSATSFLSPLSTYVTFCELRCEDCFRATGVVWTLSATLRPELLLPTSSGVRLLPEDYTGGCTSLSVACAALGSSPEAVPKVSRKTYSWSVAANCFT